MADNANKYSVLHWGSHPDADNDDCYSGHDFDSLAEAQADEMYKSASFDVMYIQVDGPDFHEIRKNPNYSARAVRFEDSLERSERAMQAGMAFGCQGYNEEMGYE